MKKILQKIFCDHLGDPLEFVSNVGEFNIRSMWKCKKCGKYIGRINTFQPGEVSDGYHTFNELYHHRAVLFSVICNSHPDIAWKSKIHTDGTMYKGMFIVGINTSDGQATYHYDTIPYWELFDVQELERAPEWDGHTPTQAIERISRIK